MLLGKCSTQLPGAFENNGLCKIFFFFWGGGGGGQRECIMGDSKKENTENNNLTPVPYGEFQEFYYLLMRRKWILITT